MIIFCLDEGERAALDGLWSGWRNSQICIASPVTDPIVQPDTACFQVQTPEGLIASRTLFEAMRCSPPSVPIEKLIPTSSLLDLLGDKRRAGTPVSLCVDLREVRQRRDALSTIPLVDEVLIVVEDVPAAPVQRIVSECRGDGLLPAGRPFGQAGYSRVFMRPTSLKRIASMLTAQIRVSAGHLVAHKIAARKERARGRDLRGLAEDSDSILNADPVGGVTHLGRAEVESVIEQVMNRPSQTWDVAVEFEKDPDQIADDSYSRFGVWPISFSYPYPLPLGVPASPLSPIVPGFPYTFIDNDHYMSTYARSAMAITHRKAGWDCFRHVEIMASGAIPLMPDAADIPNFSMVHYPKMALRRVAELALSQGGFPSQATRRAFRSFFEKHLTTLAMMQYVLRVVDMIDVESALFVDEQTSRNPEYLSTLSLIGLKQLLGPMCDVAFPADFLYHDSPMSAAHFYGRGFGYSHSLDGSSRSRSEKEWTIGYGLEDMSRFDVVVVGSVSRNADLTAQVLSSVDPSRVILIHGEDTPPINKDYERLVASGAHVFVRSIYR